MATRKSQMYSAVFRPPYRRIQSIDNNYINEFLESHDIKLFYLHNKHLDYMKRGPKDRIIYDAKDYARLMNLFRKSLRSISETPISWMAIDTSTNNLERTTNLIKRNL